MEFIRDVIEIVLHLDKYLDIVIRDYGTWTYAILFLIIFCETGLVVTPFLPGDSLLFAVGTLAALGSLDVRLIIALLITASFSGDNVNYWIGRFTGPKVFCSDKSRLLNRKHLDRTCHFYEKYGRKTIIIARFVPIVRTFAPFVAGIGRMRYGTYVLFSMAGGVLWITSLVLSGYFFGNIPVVKNNFSLVILAIIIISVMPGVIEYLRHRFGAR
ncbi:MAG TPA: DedA family protein [Dissulfurispiraceae bacterium]|nr:DedA family protein [Dissulfurispiraceae bacterium]